MSEKSDFPSQEYMDLCIEHQEELRREWKKRGARPGDAYINKGMVNYVAPFVTFPILVDDVPLFTLGQLVRMVEEAGGENWDISGNLDGKGYRGVALVIINKNIKYISEYGSSPEIAMLRAWLEVVRCQRDT